MVMILERIHYSRFRDFIFIYRFSFWEADWQARA